MSHLWRLAFVAYALLIAVLTHWPGMRIEAPIPRPDLYVHASVFGLWTLLCARSEFFGTWGTGRGLVICAVVAVGYAGIDEWTQKFFGRYNTWDDYGANLVGVASAIAALAIWHRLRRASTDNTNGC